MSDHFDPTTYGPALAALIGDEPAMPLDAGRPDPEARPVLAQASVDSAFAGQTVIDRGAAECCLAAVWLLHGYLDEAHAICQDVPSASGSYWHGVMHRREGDYGNACYWFRRAGEHPAGPAVASAAAELEETASAAPGGHWNPDRFVDLVQQATRQGGPLAEACIAVQRNEWRALLDRCWHDAVGD